MEMKIIPVEEILPDETFRFARKDSRKISRIERSFILSGLLAPIWIRKSEKGYQVLSGFSRLEAARSAGLVSVSVLAVSNSIPAGELLYQILLVHYASSDFNVMEKARILKLVSELGSMDTKIKGQILALLELPDKSSLLDEIKALLSLDPLTQNYFEEYGISLKQAAQFLQFNAEELCYCRELAVALLIRPVELLELGTQLRESAKRDDASMQDLAESLGIPEVLNSDLTRGQKVQKIKQRISAHRYPKLTKWNAAIEKSARSLGLPVGVQIKWDKTLEKPGIQINADLKSREDIQGLVDCLSTEQAKHEFSVLFDSLP